MPTFTGTSGADRAIASTGELTGNGAAAAVAFASIGAGMTITAADFVVI